jgi:hypothetical protein
MAGAGGAAAVIPIDTLIFTHTMNAEESDAFIAGLSADPRYLFCDPALRALLDEDKRTVQVIVGMATADTAEWKYVEVPGLGPGRVNVKKVYLPIPRAKIAAGFRHAVVDPVDGRTPCYGAVTFIAM